MRLMTRGLRLVLFGAMALGVVTAVVMSLWNWLLPGLFGWRAIGFWQALGLLILCRILFGGFDGPNRHTHWRQRWERRWAHMTPEERERFRQGLQTRCGVGAKSEDA